jgi:hypothetical protein
VRSRRLLAGIAAALLTVIGLMSWLIAPAYTAEPRLTALPLPDPSPSLTLTGPDGLNRRQALLRQATFHHRSPPPSWPALDSCSFVPDEPSGTSPKFSCQFANGEVMKVKYGRNAEPHAEVAATTLLSALGYGADHVTFSPKLRCYGCPRFPFPAMHVASMLRSLRLPVPAAAAAPDAGGYTDFDWVSVERNLEAVVVKTDQQEGWSWWELRQSQAPRAELDAFRLLAVFLAHWDNKASNQRLVCPDAACSHPIAMMQDVGATFGPTKVNLSRWREEPIWADRDRCLISMATLPFDGATFPPATVTEAGRALLASELSSLSDRAVRQIFKDARFPEFQSGTDDEHDLDAWTAAFKHRVRQIVTNRCPES